MKLPEENKWEAFAQEHAEYYVDTKFMDYPVDKRREKFFNSGRKFTAETLARVEEMLPNKERALEIGAGVGRLTLPHARFFDEVIAVDTSPTMLKKLEHNAQRINVKNIRTFLPEEQWDNQKMSYIYSYLVFQHITEPKVIVNYIQRIAGCLKKDGIAQLQFDTRAKSVLYKMRNKLPDFILPENQKKGIRRIRRNPEQLRNLFNQNELKIKAEIKPDSFIHTFILKK